MKFRRIFASVLIATAFGSQAYAQMPENNYFPFIQQPVKENTKIYYEVPKTPQKITFAGEEIDLSTTDRHERMDREMLAFNYSHQLTILMLKRTTRIFPQVEPILKEYGIPDDLKYLMVIESNLVPTIVSPAGAAGLWQMMTATGKQYGLEVSETVDERFHIEKATRAACRYLKEAYEKYGDWMSVCASYNAGQARISNALEKQIAETAMDLWLVEETSRYMYRILAAKLFLENPAEYGFKLEKEDYYQYIPPKEKVKVTDTINDLAAFARSHGVSYLALRTANPWLKGFTLLDKSHKEYTILIPQE
ncbi:MAG: lytic transglycosylase domain-containing protein [Bacteroidales bacterium]|nr:lytic transglycosylase domain-containing protein [Bacteroidales bacterium]